MAVLRLIDMRMRDTFIVKESKLKRVSRDDFKKMMDSGRKFCWATLYEKQDFLVELNPGDLRPVRDITNDPKNWHRRIGAK